MKNIIFIAPPAAGKGVQSKLLNENYNYEHISTGDLLRDEINSKSPLGIKINDIISKGLFVSDDIITDMLVNKLSSVNGPFILDGYPRNINQANKLNEILEKVNKKIDIVIFLDVSLDVGIKRATGRLLCNKCNLIYNKYTDTFVKENCCNTCGSLLIKRDDDTEETYKKRYETYLSSTSPLLEFYKDKLVKINADQNPELIFNEIKKVIL